MPDSQMDRNEQFLRAFTTHEPAVRAFVRRLVPSRADADDVLQEIAIVLWKKFDEFRDGGDFKAWACGVARLKVLSWLRDKGRDRLVLSMDVVEMIADDSLRAEPRLQRQRVALESCFEKDSTDGTGIVGAGLSSGMRSFKTSPRRVDDRSVGSINGCIGCGRCYWSACNASCRRNRSDETRSRIPIAGSTVCRWTSDRHGGCATQRTAAL